MIAARAKPQVSAPDEFSAPTAAEDEQGDHEPDKSVETGHALILTDADQAVQTDTQNPTSTYPDG